MRTLPVAMMLAFLTGVSAPPAPRTGSTPQFAAGRTDCAVYADGVSNPYGIVSVFVLPGESVNIGIAGRHANEEHSFEIATGHTAGGANVWNWTAPAEPGVHVGRLRHAHSDAATTVNFFVMVPRAGIRGGALNGYAIGEYPRPLAGRESLYRTPRGFVEVTPANRDIRVSPHFTLGQFLCKQESGYPMYVVLEERLLVALEAILEAVNSDGFAASSLFVMSGYRTPVYNRAIGNVANSRHVFGDAADIYVDQNPADGVMDDLNGDGRIDTGDTAVLARLVEETLPRIDAELGGDTPVFRGGMGQYPANTVHGPFVHVDLRGYRARW